jgi:hypothetical protein
MARPLARWLFGMLGSFVLVSSLPRLLKLTARKAGPRLVREFFWAVLAGLAFEWITRWISRDDTSRT